MHADSYMHSLSVFCSERPGRSRGGRQREGDIGGVVGGGWKSASAVRAAREAAAAAAAAAARASEGGPGGEGVASRRRRRGGDGDRRGSLLDLEARKGSLARTSVDQGLTVRTLITLHDLNTTLHYPTRSYTNLIDP